MLIMAACCSSAMSTVPIVVVYNNENYSVDLDLDESVEVLKFQLYSLTNVPPERQRIIGLAPVLKDSTDLRSIGVKAGQRVILMGAPEVAAEASSSFQAPLFQEDVSAWQSACSAIFISEPVAQPSFTTSSNKNVCFACGTTCHLPNSVRPRLSTEPMRCQCSQDMCLFEARVHSAREQAQGQLRDLMVAEMARAQQQQVYQMKMGGTQKMAARIKSNMNHMMIYEQPEVRQKALSVIPVALLEERCRIDVNPLPGRDELLKQLLYWFKHEFFTWCNSPPCRVCNGSTQAMGGTQPTVEEQRWMAGIVEVHKCNQCAALTRFPRYNHPAKLLETRTGRCGEWANCFTLCCRALDFEARSAHDWTDHVWTEVYSETQQRWLHCDSCENAMDKPLLYEAGWGKKLTYVVATSKDECVDVTRRYTQKWREVAERRNECPEEWLDQFLNEISQQRLRSLPESRVAELRRRREKEHVELEANVRSVSVGELQGRISGSVKWRQARHELGVDEARITALKTVLQKINETVIVASGSGDCLLKYDMAQGNWERSEMRPDSLMAPTAVTISSNGDLIVAGWKDQELGQVIRINADSGSLISVIAKGGELNKPQGLAIGSDGVLFVSNSGDDRILRFNPESGEFLGAFPRSDQLKSPHGMCFDKGVLYVCSKDTNKVLKFNTSGELLGVAAVGAGMGEPTCVCIHPLRQQLFVGNSRTHNVLSFNLIDGSFIGVAASGWGLREPSSIAIHPSGSMLVGSAATNQIMVFDLESAHYSGVLAVVPRPSAILFPAVERSLERKPNGSPSVVFESNRDASDPATMALIAQRTFAQVVVGCGEEGCTTVHCKSNPNSPALDSVQSASLIMQLVSSGSDRHLCPKLRVTKSN
eukprot:GILK01008945.1.p1 GENE.GILK01008945.1~~GILK01008945.1.p1  ORF type:complete len:877 (-),score=138.60 GILK01008945.1:98-2728(-)